MEAISGLLRRLKDRGFTTYEPVREADVLIGWLRRRGSAGIADDLELTDDESRLKLVGLFDCLKRVAEAESSHDLRHQVEVLAEARIYLSGSTPNKLAKARGDIWVRYTDKLLNSTPGDLFFLNELAPGVAGGFVVYLRRLSEIQDGEIAVTPIEARERQAVRVSRLAAPFRYRLTQKLASVFSDIGLPTEYEKRCATTLAQLQQDTR